MFTCFSTYFQACCFQGGCSFRSTSNRCELCFRVAMRHDVQLSGPSTHLPSWCGSTFLLRRPSPPCHRRSGPTTSSLHPRSWSSLAPRTPCSSAASGRWDKIVSARRDLQVKSGVWLKCSRTHEQYYVELRSVHNDTASQPTAGPICYKARHQQQQQKQRLNVTSYDVMRHT